MLEESGITLVVLIVTIVVMLILASVTIANITGGNGTMDKANDAKDQSEIQEEKEKISIAVVKALEKGQGDELDENYLILGNLHKIRIRHNVQNPSISLHGGNERQRFIIPRMYMQKINSFSIRVEGTGYGEFYMMEKEWRIR